MFQRAAGAIRSSAGPFATALYFAVIMIVAPWAFIGAVGWFYTMPDPWTRAAAVSMHFGSVIFASCGPKLVVQSKAGRVRIMLLAGLALLAVAVTSYGGHQGLLVLERRTWAAHDAYVASLPALDAANARLSAITAEIDALAPVPLTYAAGQPIGAQTRRLLMTERSLAFDRLQRAENEARIAVAAATVTPVPAPGQRMSETMRRIFTVVAELIEIFGFLAISLALSGRRDRGETSNMNGLVNGTDEPDQASRKRRPRAAARRDKKTAQSRDRGTGTRKTRMGQTDISAQQQRALALKAANPELSFRDIETETGVPKSTLQRMWKRHHNSGT